MGPESYFCPASMVFPTINMELKGKFKKEEKCVMMVTYKDFTGELVKLERLLDAKGIAAVDVTSGKTIYQETKTLYSLSLYDKEKEVTHCFTNVKLEDVKFLGGAVTFSE